MATPIPDIDDETGRLSLLMVLDENKQFRVAKIEAFGPDPKMEALLKSKFKPGDVLNSQLIENVLAEHKSSLPPDVSIEDVDLRRNVRRGTVNLQFNFQACEPRR